jgi:hypothetical protein
MFMNTTCSGNVWASYSMHILGPPPSDGVQLYTLGYPQLTHRSGDGSVYKDLQRQCAACQ